MLRWDFKENSWMPFYSVVFSDFFRTTTSLISCWLRFFLFPVYFHWFHHVVNSAMWLIEALSRKIFSYIFAALNVESLLYVLKLTGINHSSALISFNCWVHYLVCSCRIILSRKRLTIGNVIVVFFRTNRTFFMLTQLVCFPRVRGIFITMFTFEASEIILLNISFQA